MKKEKISIESLTELFRDTEQNGFYNDDFKLPPGKGDRIINRLPEQYWRLVFSDSPLKGMSHEIGKCCFKWEGYKLDSMDTVKLYLAMAKKEKFPSEIDFKIVLPQGWENSYIGKMYAVIFYKDQYVQI